MKKSPFELLCELLYEIFMMALFIGILLAAFFPQEVTNAFTY